MPSPPAVPESSEGVDFGEADSPTEAAMRTYVPFVPPAAVTTPPTGGASVASPPTLPPPAGTAAGTAAPQCEQPHQS
eukprot:5791332-Alexandrium_andersonii.AAC.1